MPRQRFADRLSRTLTFGGRVPSAVGLLVALVVVSSIAGALIPPLVSAAAFAPGRVLNGEIWRLITWSFFETSPLNLIFAALFFWWFGRDLSAAWGERRLVGVFLGLTLASAALTLLVALLIPLAIHPYYLGSWAVLSGLTVAWGLLFADRQILFYMVLPVSGRALVWVTVGGTLLFALFERSVAAFVPHLMAQSLAALYVRGGLSGRLWRKSRWNPFEKMRRERERKRFKVIEVDHDPDRDPPRWLN